MRWDGQWPHISGTYIDEICCCILIFVLQCFVKFLLCFLVVFLKSNPFTESVDKWYMTLWVECVLFYVATNQLWDIDLFALFSVLLRFYLPFAFTVIHWSERRPGLIYHMSWCKVDVGREWGEGRWLIFKYVQTKLGREVPSCQVE